MGFWAPFKLLTLLGGMLRERKKIQGVSDVEFPTSMLRWGLKGQDQVHGNGISAHLNLSTAFTPTYSPCLALFLVSIKDQGRYPSSNHPFLNLEPISSCPFILCPLSLSLCLVHIQNQVEAVSNKFYESLGTRDGSSFTEFQEAKSSKLSLE